MNNLFTPSAKNVLMMAQEQAKKFNHHALGTEHLLLAIVLENEGIAGTTLRELGVNSTDVLEEIERLTGYGDAVIASGIGSYLPYSPKPNKYSILLGSKRNKLIRLKLAQHTYY